MYSPHTIDPVVNFYTSYVVDNVPVFNYFCLVTNIVDNLQCFEGIIKIFFRFFLKQQNNVVKLVLFVFIRFFLVGIVISFFCDFISKYLLIATTNKSITTQLTPNATSPATLKLKADATLSNSIPT